MCITMRSDLLDEVFQNRYLKLTVELDFLSHSKNSAVAVKVCNYDVAKFSNMRSARPLKGHKQSQPIFQLIIFGITLNR